VLPPNFYNQGDQGIYAAGDFFIPQEKFRAAPYNVNTPNNPDEVPAGIPAIYQSQGGGGGGGYTGSVNDLMKNYTLDTRKQYFGSQPTPLVDNLYQSKLDKTFMGFPSYREQQLTGPDMGEYIGSGTDVPLELTGAGKVQNTLGNIKDTASGIMSKIGGIGPVSMLLGSMDKFDTLSAADQEFIKQNMGYRGPTVFGENTSGLNKDPFGLNTRSAFGNYAERVGKEATSLGESLGGRLSEKYGATFNPETGMFESEDEAAAAKANKMTKMMRAKFNFYTQKENERIRNEKLMEQQAAAAAAAAAAASRAESARQYNPDVHGPNNYGLGSDGQQSYDSGQGFGTNATTGGPVSNKTGRGRTDYMDGGLADMLEIYD
jgi:hypothetical protein